MSLMYKATHLLLPFLHEWMTIDSVDAKDLIDEHWPGCPDRDSYEFALTPLEGDSILRDKKCVVCGAMSLEIASSIHFIMRERAIYYSNNRFYALQNAGMGYWGDAPYFWRRGGCGYTPFIDECEHFTEIDADDHIRSTKGTHQFVKWPINVVMRSYRKVAIIGKMRRDNNGQG